MAPRFCTHCQNIGLEVFACRWLYPEKETIAPKEQIAQGKKQVPTKKVNWVPIKDNPSSIGSSIAFGARNQIVTPPVVVQEQTEIVIVSP